MELYEELKKWGIDVKGALERLGNNETLYKRLLLSYADMMKTSTITAENFDARDQEQLTALVHTIKGTSGNLSLTPLYEAYTKILELLRKGDSQAAKKRWEEILPTQKGILLCIETFLR